MNTKLVLSALGIAAMLTGPAFAQKPHRQVSQQTTAVQEPSVAHYPDGSSRSGSESSQYEQNYGQYPVGSGY